MLTLEWRVGEWNDDSEFRPGEALLLILLQAHRDITNTVLSTAILYDKDFDFIYFFLADMSYFPLL